jgi:uncharacterized protein GlcG (DUF336 family)
MQSSQLPKTQKAIRFLEVPKDVTDVDRRRISRALAQYVCPAEPFDRNPTVRRILLALTSLHAQTVIAAGENRATEIGVPINISVLDAAAHLKAFSRMDGALLGSIDIAIGKAKTAVLFGMATEAIGEFCKPGGTSPGLEQTNGGLVVFAGGIPLFAPDGALLGAVGVSGGAVAQDREIAEAAVAALG